VLLDQLAATTGWSRANARRALMVALKRKGSATARKSNPRSRKYVYHTRKLLIQVWNLAGRPSGKYLAATVPNLWACRGMKPGPLPLDIRAEEPG